MPRPARTRPAITDAWLRRAARSYLRLHPATCDRLRLVLTRKVDRALASGGDDRDDAPPGGGGDREDALARIDALLEALREAGELDDDRLVRARADSLLRQGVSLRAMRARLARQDAPAAVVEAAIRDLSAQSADPELLAAIAYARRRRMGPFSADRAARRERDLSAMGRAGFEPRAVLAVIDAASEEDLIARVAGR